MLLNGSALNVVALNAEYSPVFLAAMLSAGVEVNASLALGVRLSAPLFGQLTVQSDLGVRVNFSSSLHGQALISADLFKEVNPSASIFGRIQVSAPLLVLRYAEYLGNQRSAFVPTEETTVVLALDLWQAQIQVETLAGEVPGELEQVRV